jgi:hypothetical protein
MTYKLTFGQRPTFLHAIVTDQNSRENVLRYFGDITKECIAQHCSRVLIEERLEGPRLGTMDVFTIASEANTRFKGMLKAVAYVDVNQEGDLMQFAENLAVNRGFPVTIFPTVADAEKWLLDGDAEDTRTYAAANSDKQDY